MRKSTLLSFVFIAFASITLAQVENFEPISMNYMGGGATDVSLLTVVPNPDKSDINLTNNVVKFERDKDGVPWGGFWSSLPVAIDVTTNKYVHVKVWKSRVTPIKFKIEGGAAGNLEIASINPQTISGQWEEIVFDFSAKTGTYPIIAFMPDFEDPLTLTEDIILYFDEITLNNDPAVGSDPVVVIENFESIALNAMLGGIEDESSFSIALNPDKKNTNPSNYVIKYVRDKDGVPWGGFWSSLPVAIDLTENKYIHVKVWKSRISPIKFKVEGGAAGNSEIFSINPQTKINEWEDIVFDFSAKTGTYPVIAFMPDFEDPLTLTEDMVIYFDDIILNNVATPIEITRVPDNKFTGKVKMYPNPMNDVLFVSSTIELSKAVFNSVLGQVVYTHDFKFSGESINVSSLKRGMYIVTFVSKEGKSFSQKIIKE